MWRVNTRVLDSIKKMLGGEGAAKKMKKGGTSGKCEAYARLQTRREREVD